MGKRIICKNAIVIFNGNIGEITRAELVRQQYPKRSTFVHKDDLMVIGCDIKKDYNALDIKTPLNQFPKFSKPLFDDYGKQNSSDSKQTKTLTKQNRN